MVVVFGNSPLHQAIELLIVVPGQITPAEICSVCFATGHIPEGIHGADWKFLANASGQISPRQQFLVAATDNPVFLGEHQVKKLCQQVKDMNMPPRRIPQMFLRFVADVVADRVCQIETFCCGIVMVERLAVHHVIGQRLAGNTAEPELAT